MKVIHIDERLAQRLLEVCEQCEALVKVAETLTEERYGRGISETRYHLRQVQNLLRKELDLPTVSEEDDP